MIQMSIDTVLQAVSLAISVGALVPVFLLDERKKVISLTIAVVALVVLSSVAVYRGIEHGKKVEATVQQIKKHIGNDALTFDQLYERLRNIPSELLTEALNQAVDREEVGHKVLTLKDEFNRSFRVRTYYLATY